MKALTPRLSTELADSAASSGVDAWARSAVFKLLRRLRYGHLCLEECGQVHEFGAPESTLRARITIHSPRAYRDVLLSGSMGAAQAYMDRTWSATDLTTVIRVFVANMQLLDELDGRGRWGQRLLTAGGKLLSRAWHAARANTRGGARRNIAAHYDLGNEFFSLFLDAEMMYSAAIFPDPAASLDEAARHKIDHICQRLQLNPGDHLLEIGTGWGGLAIHAARHYGCRVTTTTISREQQRHAARRVKELGLEGQVEVLLQDYRELQGRFDKLVSVEMIEAVGHRYYRDYFRQCARLLTPRGLGLIQAITIADQRFEQAQRSVDFIQRYIFPGGALPSIEVIARHVARDTDLNITGLEDITQHYARTLKSWRERFLSQLEAVRAQGFDERFIRMWEYYLCYCEGGFRERAIGTCQVLLAKPQWRPGSQ